MALSTAVKTVQNQKYLHIVDEKSPGTTGGVFNSGAWRTRILNTVKVDEIGTTLSSNQFTLPAGKYRCKIIIPAYQVDGHKARLYNITDSVVVLLSNGGATPSNGWNQFLEIVGQFSIAAQKTFEVQHNCNTSNNDGFGQASSITATNEIFTIVEIIKIEEVSVVEFSCT